MDDLQSSIFLAFVANHAHNSLTAFRKMEDMSDAELRTERGCEVIYLLGNAAAMFFVCRAFFGDDTSIIALGLLSTMIFLIMYMWVYIDRTEAGRHTMQYSDEPDSPEDWWKKGQDDEEDQ